MPILHVLVGAKKSPELSRALSDVLVDLTTTILKKKRDVIAIALQFVEPDDWTVAGRSLAEHGKASFYFDIRITDETNTKAEKAAYIDAAFQAFARILGDVHEESYIHVHDVRAAAYGFGGKTQEFRWQHA